MTTSIETNCSRATTQDLKKAINRQFSASSFVRQLSSSSWNSFKSAVSRNSSGSFNNNTSDEKSRNKVTEVEVTVEYIRSLVLGQINENDPSLYHENDVVKVKTNHWFIDRFIKDDNNGRDTNIGTNISSPELLQERVTTIVNSIIECLKWRKEVGINDLKGENFPKEFYDTALFSIGQLDEENLMLYLTGRRFKRIDGFTDLWIEFFLYCYESQYETYKDGTKIEAMLDVSGVGISAVDLPLFFKLMTIVLKYYPCLITKVYILDMSWIFKPIAKVIFAVLPKKYANMVSFVWKDELKKDKIGSGKIPDFMGGNIQTYRIASPLNCKSLSLVAQEKGITETQVKKGMKILNEISKQIEKEKLEG